MAKASDFYFSTTKNFVPDKLNNIYAVLIAPKKEYDERGIVDPDNSDYDDLVDFGVYDFLIDIDEGIFELNDINTKPEDLELRLKSSGFIHNPALDSKLDSWIKDCIAKNDEYKKPAGKAWGKKNETQKKFNPKINNRNRLDENIPDETEID